MHTLRAGPLLEVLAFAAAILAFIWWLQPLDRSAVSGSFYILIVAFAVGSNLLHGDSLRRLGFRLDNFGTALRDVAPATLIAIALFLLAGAIAHTMRHTHAARVLVSIVGYYGWGLVQQYALQGFVLRRLQDAGLGQRAPLAAAVLFALMHLPNPGLMAVTFAGGWIWCSSFQRHPNLFALALSHALGAVAASLTLPPWFISALHVGPSYFRTR